MIHPVQQNVQLMSVTAVTWEVNFPIDDYNAVVRQSFANISGQAHMLEVSLQLLYLKEYFDILGIMLIRMRVVSIYSRRLTPLSCLCGKYDATAGS